MMRSRLFLLAPIAALVALSACGEKKAEKGDSGRTASGQILPGSISDGMIAYDALTSQPPAAPRTAPINAASADSAAPTEAPAEEAKAPTGEPSPATN